MLLAVDVGNTNTKFGIFDGEKLTSTATIPTITDFSSENLYESEDFSISKTISEAIVCSVRPDTNDALRKYISLQFNTEPLFVDNDADFGLKINYEPIQDLGTDRLVNAFAAKAKYGTPCIAASFGTACTIDFVSCENEFMGGLIAPGANSISAALTAAAPRLPKLEFEKPRKIIQRSTLGALKSGIAYGYFSMVEGLIRRMKTEIGADIKVVATGGFAKTVAANIDGIDIVDRVLLLDGLRLLYKAISTD